MGQPLPLPERIPRPNETMLKSMQQSNIQVNMSDESSYVTYTLPSGWNIVNASWRQDLPNWHIIDEHNIIQYSISGAWKETYDNDIKLYNGSKTKYVEKTTPQIPSETSTVAILGNICDALHSSKK